MHSRLYRICSVLVIAMCVVSLVLVAYSGATIRPIEEPDTEPVADTAYTLGKDTIHLWYTDDALTDYLNYICVEYASDRDDVRVVPVLVSGREYLESISDASMSEDEMPDLYITTNDMLEKAHLAGLADGITPPANTDLREVFSPTAINAVTYHSEYIAYPLFMECSALCYNHTYITAWAREVLEGEIRSALADEEAASEQEQGQEKSKSADSTGTDEKKEKTDEEKAAEAKALDEYVASQVADEDVSVYIDEHLPESYEKLIDFSNSYDAPQGVDTVFKWAVNDIFYNYFFVGDSIRMGGPYGDDTTDIDIYNENAIRGLIAYQSLNQFFSINTDDVSYLGVLDEFRQGSLVMTIVTTDAVSYLKQAAANGEMDFEYRFLPLPDINSNIKARSLSVTDVVAVNGYSSRADAAGDFAYFLCTADPRILYERTGKVSVLSEADFGDDSEYIDVFRREYDRSIPLPKMLETSNFWASLEMLFASVWNGEDANAGLKKLSEKMMLQITGEEYTETPIAVSEF